MLQEIIKTDILLDGDVVLAGVNTVVVINEDEPRENWEAYVAAPGVLPFGMYTLKCNRGRIGEMHLSKRVPGPKGLFYEFRGAGRFA